MSPPSSILSIKVVLPYLPQWESILPFDVLTPDIETNSDSEFEVNDTRKDLIEEIKLTELKFKIISPDDTDFSFFESLEVYISA